MTKLYSQANPTAPLDNNYILLQLKPSTQTPQHLIAPQS